MNNAPAWALRVIATCLFCLVVYLSLASIWVSGERLHRNGFLTGCRSANNLNNHELCVAIYEERQK